MAKILITGGTGLIGMHLSNLLTQSAHEVVHLSRSSGQSPFKTYKWDLERGEMDVTALAGVDHIVHLAGAGVADKRWTEARKRIILDSRTAGIDLLYNTVKAQNIRLRSFVSASGIGYYGMDTGDQLLDEYSTAGNDFLAEVVKEWEGHADAFSTLTKVAKIRIGVVLSMEGGALPSIARPVKYFVGAPLGNGRQYVSWIHIEDLCRIFQFVVENEMEGMYNAVAPNPVTNSELTRQIAKTLHRPLILRNVPALVLKILLGEMSQVVLGGNKVSSEALQKEGFSFRFVRLNEALNDLLK